MKRIARYLPYGVRVLRPDKVTILEARGLLGTLVQCEEKGDMTYSSISGCSLILRPIQDLAKEITHRGKKFVPIVELAKVAYDGEWERARFTLGVYQCDCHGVYFGFEPEDGSFIVASNGKPTFTPKQRELFDLLDEWLFDYRGLIEAGFAVDVNTLKENCYESDNE